MSQGNYWTRFSNSRLTRRRMILAGSSVGLSAAALSLLGCGGDDEGTGPSTTGSASATTTSASTGSTTSSMSSGSTGATAGSGAGSGLVYTPVDTTAQAKPGGDLPLVGSERGFDFLRSAAENEVASPMYSRLLKYQAYAWNETLRPTVEGDAATSWEVSPDGMTYTFKLRPNMKFDPRPPSNGKVLTAEDVKYSWDLYEAESVGREVLANSAAPDAPVASVSVPDETTVVMQLAFPYAPLPPMLAYNRYLFIVHANAFEEVEFKVDGRGSGAWRLIENEPDSRYIFEKNPDWYDADKVLLDKVSYFIVPEYASRLSQIRAGNLASLEGSSINNVLDVIQAKKELPELLLGRDPELDRTPFWLRFGYKPESEFMDERVRKAVSMLTDRDLYVDVFGNVPKLREEGLDPRAEWNTCFGAGEVWWLDPRGSDFGESAKWFQYDPDEAKKLMEAAGYSSPLDLQFTLSGMPGANTLAHRSAEVLSEMWNSTGLFNFTLNYVDLNSVFRPDYHWNYGQHLGISIGGGGGDYPDVDGNLFANFKAGVARSGYVQEDGSDDPVLEEIIAKQRVEQDEDARIALLHDFQRRFAEKMYFLHEPGTASQYFIAQPWYGNWQAFRVQPGGAQLQEIGGRWWIDESKRS